MLTDTVFQCDLMRDRYAKTIAGVDSKGPWLAANGPFCPPILPDLWPRCGPRPPGSSPTPPRVFAKWIGYSKKLTSLNSQSWIRPMNRSPISAPFLVLWSRLFFRCRMHFFRARSTRFESRGAPSLGDSGGSHGKYPTNLNNLVTGGTRPATAIHTLTPPWDRPSWRGAPERNLPVAQQRLRLARLQRASGDRWA